MVLNKLVRSVFLLLLVVPILSSCGSAEPTPVARRFGPSATPLGGNAPTAETTPTIVADSGDATAIGQDIEQGKAALAIDDYEIAVEHFTAAYLRDTSNIEVATLLADTYLAWGERLIGDANNDPATLRAAYDHFGRGAEVAPQGSASANTLEENYDAVAAVLETLDALDAYDAELAGDADLAAITTEAERAYRSIEEATALVPSFPNLNQLRYRALMAMGISKERAGDGAQERATKRELWQEGLGFCEQAREIWGDETEPAATSIECINRIDRKLNPPQVTNTPRPQPTAVPAPAPAPAPAPPPAAPPRGYIERGYPQGGQTGQASSCLEGRVVRPDGSAIAGAVGEVNNGGSSVPWTSGPGGTFSVCGLGWSNWAAVLFYAPGKPPLNVPVYGNWLNGAGDQRGFVVFIVP